MFEVAYLFTPTPQVKEMKGAVMRFPIRRSMMAAFCTAGILLGVSAVSAREGRKVSAKPASTNAASKFEIDFLTTMIEHHAMAVQMARTCSTRATHAELRTLCEQIKTAQQSEITTMQGWLQSWYGITHNPKMKQGDMRQMTRLGSLSGSAFEIAFLEMMVQHHQMAIREADPCLRRASHAELKTLCQNIHTAQQAEIAQMKRWLCQWYKKCR